MPSFAELFEFSSTDLVLLLLFLYVLYKLFFKRHHVELAPGAAESPAVAPLPKQDMTVDQLARFNGVDDEHICLAICGKIFDVTKGKDFYGPGGAYGALAGHDATRALGTMDIRQVRDHFDDHSGMDPSDLEDAREWEQRLAIKYPLVGRLLSPGEEPTNYGTETEQGN